MNIAEFLAACLDEDETIARATRQASPSWQNFDVDGELRDSVNAGTVARVPADEDRAHIARHDPARVLADIAAKRRILARHKPILAGHAPGSWQLPAGFVGPFTGYCELCSDCGDPDGGNNTYEPWPCPEVRDHAAPYAGQTGFKPEWRIDV